jgi:AraC-like DNA-binding protein
MTALEKTTLYRNVIRVPTDTRQKFVRLDQEAAQPLKAMGVRLSGIGTFGLDYLVGYRDPSCHLILLTLSGSGFYHSPKSDLQPKSGDLLISPLGEPMLLGSLHEPWTFLWFYVNGLRRWSHWQGQSPVLTHPAFSLQLHHALEGIMSETGYAGTQSVLSESGWRMAEPEAIQMSTRAGILFGELVAEYLRQILTPLDREQDKWQCALQDIWKQVEQAPAQEWTQLSISNRLGISPITLQRHVRKCFDSTPQKMIIAIRMHHARRLLQESDYPLAVIANEVGYADAFVLSAAFKRFHGVSPSAFRESQ